MMASMRPMRVLLGLLISAPVARLGWLWRNWHHALFVIVVIGILVLTGFLVRAGLEPEWQARLNEFPTVIGALLGPVLGLMTILLGALYNAKLNRDRDARLRDEEARALAAALAAEFDVIKNGLLLLEAQVERQQEYNEPTHSNLWQPTTEVYNGSIGRLGFLGAEMAIRIANVLALATAALDTVKINWTQLADKRETAEGIKKKIRDFSREAEALSFQLEEVAIGIDPVEAINTFTVDFITEIKMKEELE